MTREPFRIVIIQGLWRGCDVVIEPPCQRHPPRHFKDHASALQFANELAALQHWPIQDRADG